MPRRRRKSGRFGCLLAVFLVPVAGLAALFCWWQLRPRPELDGSVRVVLKRNQTLHRFADTLADLRVIRHPGLFVALARVLGRDRTVRSGRYTLPLGVSEYQALARIGAGVTPSAFVTIPEGFTMRQIAARLEAEGICTREEFLVACRDTKLLRRLGVPLPSAEGYLFPDSYHLPFGAGTEELVEVMTRRFFSVARSLTQDPARITAETVIMASLVEAEAVQDSERPLVASVFYNRLRRRMPLQSCATVEYVLPERKAVLSEADTRTESPYNTYLYPGLPPGPIGNPGRRSLLAALAPARTEYLFFVSRGDGSHRFSTSYPEHLAARRKYRQRR